MSNDEAEDDLPIWMRKPAPGLLNLRGAIKEAKTRRGLAEEIWPTLSTSVNTSKKDQQGAQSKGKGK